LAILAFNETTHPTLPHQISSQFYAIVFTQARHEAAGEI